MYYLKAKFYSAKIPLGIKSGKTDMVFDLNMYLSGRPSDASHCKRTKFADTVNLIQLSQISNVLHVLLGARPAPSNRESFHHRCDYIDNIAKNTLIKVESPTTYINKDGKEILITELTQGKKNAYNSHASNSVYSYGKDNTYKGYLTWSSLKKKYYYFYPEVYYKILSEFESISGETNLSSKYTLIEFLEKMKEDDDKWNRVKELVEYIKSVKGLKDCSQLLLQNIHGFNTVSQTNLAALTINTNPIYKLCLNGELIFSIEDENDFNNILNGNKMATFLDGGFLEIVDIFYDLNEEFELENGFKKINY